jgi:hypothetical protein
MKEIMRGAFLVVVLAALAGCAATRPVAVERAADMSAAPTTSAIFFAGGDAEGTRSPGAAATRALSEANGAVTPVGWFEQAGGNTHGGAAANAGRNGDTGADAGAAAHDYGDDLCRRSE